MQHILAAIASIAIGFASFGLLYGFFVASDLIAERYFGLARPGGAGIATAFLAALVLGFAGYMHSKYGATR